MSDLRRATLMLAGMAAAVVGAGAVVWLTDVVGAAAILLCVPLAIGCVHIMGAP